MEHLPKVSERHFPQLAPERRRARPTFVSPSWARRQRHIEGLFGKDPQAQSELTAMAEAVNGERARAYQALHDSEELHRITLSNISDAIFLTDDDGLFTFICPNVDVIFGYPRTR